VYLVVCGFLVWLIIPGVGLLYGGLARRKSALSMLSQSLMVAAITTFQWMFWGFSLAYSRTASPFVGDLKNFGLINVTSAPSIGSPYVPDIVFCFYQLPFAACATMIIVGGSSERGRIIPSLVSSFCWTTILSVQSLVGHGILMFNVSMCDLQSTFILTLSSHRVALPSTLQ
jgi:Amt family ammonium transporter